MSVRRHTLVHARTRLQPSHSVVRQKAPDCGIREVGEREVALLGSGAFLIGADAENHGGSLVLGDGLLERLDFHGRAAGDAALVGAHAGGQRAGIQADH